MSLLRQQGIQDIGEVEKAFFEPSGALPISVPRDRDGVAFGRPSRGVAAEAHSHPQYQRSRQAR
ncbi:DUF421 domain-containing protein [Citreimonas salinaria]|uniref:DUF421 domain-containing protein n=1 Tax=Citreimonas salinaria TaxID=321339 RepID=UPI00115FF079